MSHESYSGLSYFTPDDLQAMLDMDSKDLELGGEGNEIFEDDGYFNYEEEVRRQEKALRAKFGVRTLSGTEGIPLTRDMIALGLSSIERPVDTTQLAYVTFAATSKNLTDVKELESYIHLTTVILSSNNIKSLLPLKEMRNLKVLNAQENLIDTINEIPIRNFKWLQALNLSSNRLQSLDGFRPNTLMYLHLANNSLDSVEYFTMEYFPNLQSLELRKNKLTTIEAIDLPKLRHLYIAENHLRDLNGINGCPELEFLHARQNQIKELTVWPTMEKLEYINLRDNHIQHFTQTINLENCPNLKAIILAENPITQSEYYHREIISACLSLKRIDRMILSETDIVEGRLRRVGRVNGTIDPLMDDPEVLYMETEEDTDPPNSGIFDLDDQRYSEMETTEDPDEIL